MNNYQLTRRYWDWAKDNPEKVKPIYAALYLYIIEKCVRLGWKEKFGLPTDMAKEAVGIKNYKTYIEALNFLVEENFLIMHQRSKNQHTANIVALVNFTEADGKADGKASPKQLLKQVQSTVSINNDYNDDNDFIMFVESFLSSSGHMGDEATNAKAYASWILLTDEEKKLAVANVKPFLSKRKREQVARDGAVNPTFLPRVNTYLENKYFGASEIKREQVTASQLFDHTTGVNVTIYTDSQGRRLNESQVYLDQDERKYYKSV